MKKSFPLALLLVSAIVSTSKGAIVWMCGLDDNGWPVGTGGGPNTSFVQENASVNPLPGSQFSTSVNFAADNDYYFAGVFTDALPGSTAFYGPYSPVGVVDVNEEAAERAFGGGDTDLRYHFNLPADLGPNDTLTITYDPFNLDTGGGADPRFGVELYFNGVLVMSQVIIRPAQIDTDIVSPPFTLASVGAVTGPGADNIVSLRGFNYNGSGGGNWMGIDYVQLDSQVVPEPSAGFGLLIGAVGLTPFVRRRRR